VRALIRLLAPSGRGGELCHCPVIDREGRWLFSSLPLVKRSRMRALGILEKAIEMPAKNVGKNPENQHL
jgi:hypothetical protein